MSRLVSVIVPAYNAQDTIDATLSSVRAQSWRELEIIVINDGSTDGTANCVLRHSAEDSRVRLVNCANGGVARARNLAIEQARGELIAPIDADDLWLPDKIERQVTALRKGGDRVGLVYCWFVMIDGEDRIIGYSDKAKDCGNVLRRMCLGNLVGNGSAPLMRREAILAAGGYDTELRDQQAQGCEDLKLYCSIAEQYHFAVVPDFLLGYRWTQGNMSSDGFQMLRSYDTSMLPFLVKYPKYTDELHLGRGYLLRWLFERSVRYGRLAAAGRLFVNLLAQNATLAAQSLISLPRILIRHHRQESIHFDGPRFLDEASWR